MSYFLELFLFDIASYRRVVQDRLLSKSSCNQAITAVSHLLASFGQIGWHTLVHVCLTFAPSVGTRWCRIRNSLAVTLGNLRSSLGETEKARELTKVCHHATHCSKKENSSLVVTKICCFLRFATSLVLFPSWHANSHVWSHLLIAQTFCQTQLVKIGSATQDSRPIVTAASGLLKNCLHQHTCDCYLGWRLAMCCITQTKSNLQWILRVMSGETTGRHRSREPASPSWPYAYLGFARLHVRSRLSSQRAVKKSKKKTKRKQQGQRNGQ